MTKATQTSMPVNNFDALSNANISKNGEKGEDGGKSRMAVNDEEWDVIDFYAVCQIADSFSVIVSMGDDDDFVTSVYELA